MLFRILLIAVLSTLVEALGRFQEEENAHFRHPFRQEPLPSLPGMVGANHHHVGPPGIMPPMEMIRAMRKEHRADVAIGHSKKHPHLVGFSRRRLHKSHVKK